ncbi:MAG: hypothetical protein ABIY48_07385 [Acidimicrobiales bacterium]
MTLGAALLAAVQVGQVSASSGAAPTRGAAAGACDGSSGVTVVVDFGTLGGGTQTRCAPEPVSSGFDALRRAGFTYEGTARFQGLLCRIDGKPSPQQDACQNAPSPTFYWAYWTASAPGGAWTYSDSGAGNRDPAPGTVEGWAFSDGCTRQPGTPTACSNETTTTTTAPVRTTTTTLAGPGGGSAATTMAAGGSVTRSTSSPTTPLGPESTTIASLPDAGDAIDRTSTTDAGSTDGVAAGASDTGAGGNGSSGAGSPVGVLIGAIAVGLLGLGAALRLRARRALTSGSGPE